MSTSYKHHGRQSRAPTLSKKKLTIRSAEPRFHGFQLARELADGSEARGLTAHGTLYKALGRLEETGLLTSAWEDPDIALAEGRPRRRLYEVTAAGERALAAWWSEYRGPRPRTRLGLEPT